MDVNWPWFLLLKLIVVLAVFSTAVLASGFHPGTFPSPEQRKVVLIISLMTMRIEIFFIYQQHDVHRYPDRANNDAYIEQGISITTLHDKTALNARDHVVCFPFDFGNKIKNFRFDDTKRWISSDRNLFDRQRRWILLCQIIGDPLIVVYISTFFCFFFVSKHLLLLNVSSSDLNKVSFFHVLFALVWIANAIKTAKVILNSDLYFCSSHQLHSKFCNILHHLVVRFDLYRNQWAFRC